MGRQQLRAAPRVAVGTAAASALRYARDCARESKG